MTQKELHKELGAVFTTLKFNLDHGKYNEKAINTAKTLAGLAKQMVQSADVSIRASKILHNNKILEDIFVNDDKN